jgi:hypothetical protein
MIRSVAAAAAAAALLSGCSGSDAPTPEPSTTSTSPTTTASPQATAPVAQRTVWLCRPGPRPDPCDRTRTSTSIESDGTDHVERTHNRPASVLDCFYVYPTVSQEKRDNSDLRIHREQRAVAFAQASRFSDVCRVWAPMYRQRTIQGLFSFGEQVETSTQIALDSVTEAWHDYLANHNGGHKVVFIGHSQGAAMLIRMLRAEVDPDPQLRAKTALAILLGANVTVRKGQLTGGSFQHLPLCTKSGEAGCVIAYSSFLDEPPPFSFFGRPGLGVSALSGETADGTTSVACVNPAAVTGGKAALHPYFPRVLASQMAPALSAALTRFQTPWTSLPDAYTGRCRSSGTATWLQVSPVNRDGDPRAQLTESMGRQWGLHIADVNLALGDLVQAVAAVARHLR